MPLSQCRTGSNAKKYSRRWRQVPCIRVCHVSNSRPLATVNHASQELIPKATTPKTRRIIPIVTCSRGGRPLIHLRRDQRSRRLANNAARFPRAPPLRLIYRTAMPTGIGAGVRRYARSEESHCCCADPGILVAAACPYIRFSSFFSSINSRSS